MSRAAWVIAIAVLSILPPPAAGMTEAESHDPHLLTWITPNVLAVGGGGLTRDDLSYLGAQGFRAEADFRAELDDGAANVHAAGLDYLYLPVGSAADITEPMLEQFVAWAKAESAAGKPIYIHCSNGWHRAPTFAIAWVMATTGASFDQAAAQVKAAREGVAIRAPGPLLAYDAILHQARAMDVKVDMPASVAAGASTRISIRVTDAGAPVAGAQVRVWTEEPGLDTTVTTDADGAATVNDAPPGGLAMQHVFARAHAPGHLDGAADPEVRVHAATTSVHGVSLSGATLLTLGAGCVAVASLGVGAIQWWRSRAARSR